MGQNAQFVSATFLGMMLGSFLTDFSVTIRRRFTYQANLAIFGLASVAAAFAPSMGVLICCDLSSEWGWALKMLLDIRR